MRTLSFFVAMVVVALAAPSVHAQNARSWVASTGSDANPCTRAAPCLTFQRAHNQTNPGGIINCVDAGDFGGVQLNRSFTIDCAGVPARMSATFGFGVFGPATPAAVTVRGVAINGFGGTTTGLDLNGGPVHVERTRISGFISQSGGVGIQFTADQGTGRLFVSDTTIANTGNTLGGVSAISVVGHGAPILGALNRVATHTSENGIGASTTSATGTVSLQVRDSVAALNTGTGISPGGLLSATAVRSVTMDGSSSVLNGTGVRAAGAASFLLMGRSTVLSNNTGLSADSGGHILTYQNNHRTGNTSNGAATGTLVPQ
jgi:hypothetical protein